MEATLLCMVTRERGQGEGLELPSLLAELHRSASADARAEEEAAEGRGEEDLGECRTALEAAHRGVTSNQ
eukprot:72182-Rhodomonas_salina.1